MKLRLATHCKVTIVSVPTVCVCVSSDVTANSVHPGVVLTDVIRYYPSTVRFLFNTIGILFFKVSTVHLRLTVLSTVLSL